MEEEILSLSGVGGAVDILSSVRKANANLKFLSNFTGESDFIDVMEEVISLPSKWKILGMALRLNTVELDSIAEEHNSDSMQCLRGVVLSWLQQHYDTKKYGTYLEGSVPQGH